MKEFYTDVSRHMNQILYRGVDSDGRKLYQKIKYKPTMYLEAKSQDTLWHTLWHTLDGTPVEEMKFESMSDCRNFQKTYEDLKDFRIYGNDRHIVSYLQERFPNEIQFDSSRISVCYFDIETKLAENGHFVEPTDATEPITLIGLKLSNSDSYMQWGLKEFEDRKSVV